MPSKTSLSVRIKAYTEALELRRKYEWGNRTIAAHVGLPYPTVNSWMVGRHSPFGSCNVPRLGPSRPLSYLAGALLGDGRLIRSPSYHYEMRFRVRDLEFAERVCDCAISVLRKQKSVKLDNKGFYEVRFWSRLLYESYLTGVRFANALASFRRNLLGALPMRRALPLCLCRNQAHQCSDFTWYWSAPI
jgi:hypothetical protein